MTTDRHLDRLRAERDRLEAEIATLNRAADLAARFNAGDKCDRIERMIDRAAAELAEIENEIPPERGWEPGVL